jgi:hypothetical protein
VLCQSATLHVVRLFPAHGREAVGGAEAWPQVHPGVVRASCAGHARRQACERLSAGWRVAAEPTMR